MTDLEARGRAIAQKYAQLVMDQRSVRGKKTLKTPYAVSLIYGAFLAGWLLAHATKQTNNGSEME